jgi:hypothetical protein
MFAFPYSMRVKTKVEIEDFLYIVDTFGKDIDRTTYHFKRSKELPVSIFRDEGHPSDDAWVVYKVAAYEILADWTDAIPPDEVMTLRLREAQQIMEAYLDGKPLPPLSWEGKKTVYDLMDDEINRLATLSMQAVKDDIFSDMGVLHYELIELAATLTARNLLNRTGVGSGEYEILGTVVSNYVDCFREMDRHYTPEQIEQAEKKAEAAYRQIEEIFN